MAAISTFLPSSIESLANQGRPSMLKNSPISSSGRFAGATHCLTNYRLLQVDLRDRYYENVIQQSGKRVFHNKPKAIRRPVSRISHLKLNLRTKRPDHGMVFPGL